MNLAVRNETGSSSDDERHVKVITSAQMAFISMMNAIWLGVSAWNVVHRAYEHYLNRDYCLECTSSGL